MSLIRIIFNLNKVKLSVLFEYLKACRLWITGIFILLYLLSHASDMASNFWLSDWSNDAASPHQGQKSKHFRLAIYACLGFSKCNKQINKRCSLYKLLYFNSLFVFSIKHLYHLLETYVLWQCLSKRQN